MQITMVSSCENCGDIELLEYHEWDQGNECGYLCEACIIQTKELRYLNLIKNSFIRFLQK